ncbi:MAG: hypothetical protein ABIK42_05620 [candidate division WOR-3 bacterium]
MMRLFLVFLLCCACGQIRPLTRADRLSPEEKIEYLILFALDEDAAKEFLTLANTSARREFLDWFWEQRGKEEHERFYLRAVKAGEMFGKLDLLGDERIPIYIRYGPPRREEYEPRPVVTESSRLFVNPAEIWTYDSLGLQFDFVKKGVGFKEVGNSRFGKAWIPRAFEEVDYGKPPPKPSPAAKKLDLAIALYRLGQREDSVEVELHYGIAFDQQTLAAIAENLIHLEFQFSSKRYGTIRSAGWYGFRSDTTAGLVVGRQRFFLPADIYQVTANAIIRDGKALGMRRAELNLIDYIRRSQPCSDIIFYALVDSHFQSPQFARQDWSRVVPLVVPEVKTGSTFYILYEIYHLTADSLNRHRAEARYEIMDLVTRQLAVIPTPARFITGSGTTGVGVERIHTMDLNPGNYLLFVRVKDLNNSREVSLTAQFKILPLR